MLGTQAQTNLKRWSWGNLRGLTSAGDVVLNPKVSVGASGVVAGCEDDAAHCLRLTDHTGDCRGGHDAVLTDHKVSDLKKGARTHCEAAGQKRILSFAREDRWSRSSGEFGGE